MFLKSIALCGFKSFCDRVAFEFGPGITGIVGPNGCGKSNIVDSFKWVLGEQSARSLRGRQMLDMIFNGSATRRSSSLAQVDLVFDNSDHSLPCDAEEVTISRKLYRSGESEYLLNRSPARLKDIRELFMDTGVGVDAYSLIEQGRVDGLLQSSPAERRTIFEEAAGISKFKARKIEAERKLERTSQNLLRVGDIVEELEKRLRSVKLQAGKARSYREYESRHNELRSTFAMAEYHRFTQESDGLAGSIREAGDRATGLRTEIDRHEAEGSQITIQLDKLGEEVAALDNRLVRGRSSMAAQEERIASSRRRAEEQTTLLERAGERAAADARRLHEADTELAQAERTTVSIDGEITELESRIEALSSSDRSLARDLAQAQAILEDEKAGIVELLRKSAQTHNEIVRLNTHRESLIGQKGRLTERNVQVTSELSSVLERKSSLQHRVREVDELIAAETQTLAEKRAESARIDGLRRSIVQELASEKERRSALISRRELLEDLERRMEGVGAGARKLLDQKRLAEVPATFDAIVGLVADVFEAEVDATRIIEAVLGDSDRFIVASDCAAFLSIVGELGELPGRLTAICLDRLPPLVNERDFSDQPGYVARAVDLVRFPGAYEQLARHLFGKTIVVEDLDAALAMAALDVSGHRFVTQGGEMVEPGGHLALGPSSPGAGLISRKSELRDIDAQLDALQESLDTLLDQLNRVEAEAEHVEAVQQELRTAIYESSTARVEATTGLQNIADAIARLTMEQPLIAQEVTLLEQQINEVHLKTSASGEALERLNRENDEKERRVGEQEGRIDAVVSARRDTQEQLTDGRVRLGRLTEKQASVADSVMALKRTIDELKESAASVNNDIELCQTRIEESRRAEAAAAAELTVIARQIGDLEAESANLRNRREELRAEIDGRTHAVRVARQGLEAAERQLHDLQMSLAQVKVRRDELVARTAQELNVDLPARYEQYEYQDHDWQRVEAEITELRGKMSRLGNVNFDAIAELEDLEKRHGFLTAQRDDLNDSQAQLQQLITRLNNESRERFEASFEQIRDHFRTMFRKLFGGGKADIILENPDDILDSGIEIVAQPPGKELRVISLMSGGEKSLTAIALLMSIFKSRPAPFAILDEVDAALDEANNDRFNRIIREFVSGSQFIIITHSKWSMHAADRLYGITMQEPGVSTRVSVQLTGANVA